MLHDSALYKSINGKQSNLSAEQLRRICYHSLNSTGSSDSVNGDLQFLWE